MFLKVVAFFVVVHSKSVFCDENCICVPYWQCKEDFSGLIDDGIDIMDIRVFRSASSNQEEAHCTGDFDVCCRVECGRRNKHFQENDQFATRILGEGNEAGFAEFPWMLGILEDKVYKCGASLIHPQVALTAAHCVQPGKYYKVRAGEWSWNTWNEPIPHQDRITAKILVHPQYNPFSLANDIALLILRSPFKFAENVGVVCLPNPQKIKLGACTASGWGKNSYTKGTYQAVLKKTHLPLIPRNACLKTLQEVKLGRDFMLHRSFICAGGNHKDTCKGDGGSPLVCPIADEDGRYHQIGVVSWGLTCGLKNTPGVYANVAMFVDWIDRKMQMYSFDTNIYKY